MKKLFLTFMFLLGFSGFAQSDSLYQPLPVVYNSEGLEIKPEYPGGVQAFYSYVMKNFKVPDVDKDMTAKIIATFVIEKDGTLTNVKIVKDPGYGFGEEAGRVLKACPQKWKPGIKNGEVVRAQYNMPITINIKSPEPPKQN